ncbi:hypothetical protein TNCV_3661461 [Trichonephila clavipes]|nr:hypothetical protein TNCV_3661461 [Trichonephila clavipes]
MDLEILSLVKVTGMTPELEVKVTNSPPACREFELCSAEDPPWLVFSGTRTRTGANANVRSLSSTDLACISSYTLRLFSNNTMVMGTITHDSTETTPALSS